MSSLDSLLNIHYTVDGMKKDEICFSLNKQLSPYKNVCAAAFSVLVSVFAYYTKNMIVCSISLIYIILYAVIFNRAFLCSFMQELKLKLFKK